MKCFIAILLLALVAVAMAVEKTPESKTSDKPIDNARDKRGYYAPYSAYSQYPYSGGYNLPYTYSPYSYPYRYSYPYSTYPYYNNPYYY